MTVLVVLLVLLVLLLVLVLVLVVLVLVLVLLLVLVVLVLVLVLLVLVLLLVLLAACLHRQQRDEDSLPAEGPQQAAERLRDRSELRERRTGRRVGGTMPSGEWRWAVGRVRAVGWKGCWAAGRAPARARERRR